MNIKKLSKNLGKQVLDLTGCTLDSVLYYVSEGTPVLAKTADGVVIIAGYDQYNTNLLKPRPIITAWKKVPICLKQPEISL